MTPRHPSGSDTGPQPYTWRNLMEPFLLIGFLAVWIVLQIWVLPKMGVRT